MKSKTPFEKFVDGDLLTDVEVVQILRNLSAISNAAGALGLPFFSVAQSAAHTWSVLRVIADARMLTYEPF